MYFRFVRTIAAANGPPFLVTGGFDLRRPNHAAGVALVIVRTDPRHSMQELRFYALGRSDQERLLFVAFTVRRRPIRIISAREMTRKERTTYEAYEDQEKPESPSDL